MIEYLDALMEIAFDAGNKIMHVYENASTENFNVVFKSDHTPLTIADELSHQVIVDGLSKIDTSIPILSEEGKQISYEERKRWGRFWCVDPLDGTKEFINRNGEFTVNIALIEAGKPVAGIIYIPVEACFYYGFNGNGSWKKQAGSQPIPIKCNDKSTNLVAIGSRTHNQSGDLAILNKLHIDKLISAGSSLKFCRIAEGIADIYVRTGPTMEWDVAAGHAIINNSGAEIIGLSGEDFLYNKTLLINEGFVCKTKSINLNL